MHDSFLFATALLLLMVSHVEGMTEPRLLDDGTMCVEGFVMDKFCVETLGWLLDKGTDYPALEYADEHSVHCMVDVKDCVDSGFEVLSGEKNSNGLYERLVTLDAAGNTKVVELARSVGSCRTCVEGYTPSKQKEGFRAVVIGMMDDDSDTDDPPIMKVTQVLPSSEGCPGASTPKPTRKPTKQPTSSGGKPKKSCEDFKKDQCKTEKTNCRWSASRRSCIARNSNNTNSKNCGDIQGRNKCKKARKKCKWSKKNGACKDRS